MSADHFRPPIIYCMCCRFWVDFGTGFGLCHVNPPTPAGDEDRGVWPMTHSSDWCGRGEREP